MASTQQSIQKLIDVATTASNGVDIRAAALEGLGYAGGARARETLLSILNNVSNGVALRSAAAVALGRASKDD